MTDLSQFKPVEQLVHKKTEVHKPRFPVIDAHNHLAQPFGGGWDRKPLSELLDAMDQANIIHFVSLDGGWGEDKFNDQIENIKNKAPDKFSIFAGIDWTQWEKMGEAFVPWAITSLKRQAANGASGLKIWKDMGLHIRDENGVRVDLDDERISDIWDTAAELRLPVLIHTADPVAFFTPIDERNERIEELGAYPEWAFSPPQFPSFSHLIDRFTRLISLHPNTTFIGAHVGCYAENLQMVSQMLDQFPNYFIDISARIGELGRQPYTARKFFIQHSDRILFGLDMGPKVDGYRLYYRFLETDDEYFNYSTREVPTQGRWYIHGIYLPDDVLQKVYSTNARKILKLERN